MGCSSLLRSPKKEEEQEVPDGITSLLPNNSHQSYTYQDFNILDEFEDPKEDQKLPQQNSSTHWDFMEWEEFGPIGEDESEGKEEQVRENSNTSSCLFQEQPKRENMNVAFWELDHYNMVALNLNLNYQDVLDAWSDRGSLWAHDCSLSFSTNNAYYMGEVPVLEEERARREASVLRYKEKRQNRLFSKKIRYQVRKLNADKRPRIKVTFKYHVSLIFHMPIGFWFCSMVILFCNESSFFDIFVCRVAL
ncbi:hypothetical protein VNO78_31299 [Psophocarpus tetragonolobus]|uniref:CCT domain-containing protein n=1 Tax=Psophocarpus tetragonolobus TaxID=3891 RepID=A0AAN9X999_PSOTE